MIQVLPGVVLDKDQKKLLYNLNPITIEENITLTVTRGHSTPMDQLGYIEKYARQHKCLTKDFITGDLHTQIDYRLNQIDIPVYAWAPTLSLLLLKGVIINPPLAFVCLQHYVRDTGEDMYGKTIYPSPHILEIDDPKPCPIDFSSRIDRRQKTERVDFPLIVSILERGQKKGIGIRYIKVEPKNSCVHTDTTKV